MSEIVYSTEMVTGLEGREFRNPRHFLAPVPGATKVYVSGDWPKIARAYEALNIPVSPLSDLQQLPAASGPSTPAKGTPATSAVVREPNT